MTLFLNNVYAYSDYGSNSPVSAVVFYGVHLKFTIRAFEVIGWNLYYKEALMHLVLVFTLTQRRETDYVSYLVVPTYKMLRNLVEILSLT